MLKSYLMAALRQFRSAKGSTAINVISFAAALACCAIIALYVRYERSYDSFHEHAERTFRLATDWGGPFARSTTRAPEGLASALIEMYPEVETATGVGNFSTSYLSSDCSAPAEDLLFVDSLFFDVFSYPLLEGSPETALDAPDAIIITESLAEYFFPGGNAMGRQLNSGTMSWTVTGVAADSPPNSHIPFKYLARRPSTFGSAGENVRWYLAGPSVYVVMDRAAAASGLVEKLNQLAAEQELRSYTFLEFSAQPLMDIHLSSNRAGEFQINSDARYVNLLTALGVLLILVAAINFINISTARYSNRALEVGVRKVLGAHRVQLARQFLGESIFLTVAAGTVALGFVLVLRPLVSTFTGEPLPVYPTDAVVFFSGVLLLGLIAGGYPALFLSQFRPVAVLKGVFRSGAGDVRLRRLLIGIQLVATIGLATGATVIYMQIQHLQNVRLGFDKERVLVIDSWTGTNDHFDAFREELLREPAVASVTTGYRPGHSSGGSLVQGETEDEYWLLHRYPADFGYLETLGIRLLEGRFLSADYPGDSTGSIVLSRSAVERLNLEEPLLGQTLNISGQHADKELVGVVEDFNVLSYNEPVAPVMIYYGRGDVLIKIRPGDVRASLDRIEAIYERFLPDRPMMYSFLDDEYAALLREEQRFGGLFSGFSMVAVVIALLGLAGLASYSVERRTREIGIRKVLGAGTGSIVGLIAGEFVWLALVAAVLAVPPGYLVVRGWLEEFAIRVDIGPTIFVAIVAATLCIVLAAVSVQAVRASRTNPAVALRTE